MLNLLTLYTYGIILFYVNKAHGTLTLLILCTRGIILSEFELNLSYKIRFHHKHFSFYLF